MTTPEPDPNTAEQTASDQTATDQTPADQTATDQTPAEQTALDQSPADVEKQRTRVQRRTKILGAVLLALAALVFWSASRLTWAHVLGADGLSPARTFDVKGSDWSPWLTPLALVLLAAILAAMSLRGWGLRIVALLVAAAGVLAAFPAISLVMGGTNDTYAATAAGLNDRYVVQLVTTNSWVAVVVLLGSLCAVAAGVLLMRVASGAGMSSKYKTPAARREELERQIFAEHKRRTAAHTADGEHPSTSTAASGQSAEADGRSASDGTAEQPDTPNERMLWDALDTGIDPTDQR